MSSSSCCWSLVVLLNVLEQVLRATLCTDSIRFVTNIAKVSTCSSAGFSLRCCNLAVFLALLFCSSIRNARACVWAGVSTSRVSSSSCIMPWEGSERACVNFNWSEALTGQVKGWLVWQLFSLGILQCEGSAGLECKWVLRPGVAQVA